MANQIDTDAKVIVGDDYGFGHPAICRLSNTIMLAAHINQSDELEIHKSTDDGVNWTLKKSLSNASGCFNFAVISSTKAGLVYQLNDNEFEVWVSIDSGENWTNKLDITGTILADNKAILLYDSELSRLHIVYQATNTEGKYSDNDGDSWTNWSSSLFTYAIYDADIDYTDNTIHVVRDYTLGNPNMVLDYSSTGSAGTIHSYQTADHTYHDKHVAIDLSGNIYFIFIKRNTSTTKEKLVVSRNEGVEIDLYAPDTDNIIVKSSTSIGVDEDNNVYVYYTKSSDEKTYYRKYNAGTTIWETEVELIGVANNRINTEKHVLAGSNKLHFVYYKAP